ncbi:MAG: hypothetical protein LJE91_02255 [Gammaproteobacteria bacterium]|nr:hypothetical protein [Gammaproteobacteria bacterium]
MIDRYARFLIRWRYITIFATLIVMGILASSGRSLQFTNDYRSIARNRNAATGRRGRACLGNLSVKGISPFMSPVW